MSSNTYQLLPISPTSTISPTTDPSPGSVPVPAPAVKYCVFCYDHAPNKLLSTPCGCVLPIHPRCLASLRSRGGVCSRCSMVWLPISETQHLVVQEQPPRLPQSSCSCSCLNSNSNSRWGCYCIIILGVCAVAFFLLFKYIIRV